MKQTDRLGSTEADDVFPIFPENGHGLPFSGYYITMCDAAVTNVKYVCTQYRTTTNA